MDSILLLHPKFSAALSLSLVALTGCCIETFKKYLMSWVDKQPWKSRMIPLQRNMMHNFGYSEAATTDERVVVDFYCFMIALCSHHLVMTLALTPAALLGWESLSCVGQVLFYAGALGDLACTAYDTLQTTLRTIFPVSFTCLGVQLPMKYFIVVVGLHHTLSMMLTVPMILYYPSMRALHILMWSLLFAGGTCNLLGCYKFTLDTQGSRRDFLRYKAIVLIQFATILFTRVYIWVYYAAEAIANFYKRGDTPFIFLGLAGCLLMTFFNMLVVIDASKALVKWIPKQMPKPAHDAKLVCHERELKAVRTEGLRRLQGLKLA